jgi:hypothetical protein
LLRLIKFQYQAKDEMLFAALTAERLAKPIEQSEHADLQRDRRGLKAMP